MLILLIDTKTNINIMLLQKILSWTTLLLVFSIIVMGCDDSSTGTESGTGTMEIRMYDAPIDSADEVNVFIERVEVNEEGTEGGWEVISEPQQSYDLLELTNGAFEVLGEEELEPGIYQQIRLILSQEGHSVVVGDNVYDLKVPSGPQTGIKLNVDAEIEPDITYVLLLDFDASRSVVKAGQSGMYLLKPVIKATNEAVTGNIAGTVSPVEAKPVVYAIAGSDTLGSTVADTTSGDFKIIGLEAGTYTLAVNPRDTTYADKNVPDVTVTVGETNNVGTIEVNQ